MKNVITAALTWCENDFDNILENLWVDYGITEKASAELIKMSSADKVKQLESYISGSQDQIIELINEIILQGMMEDYTTNK